MISNEICRVARGVGLVALCGLLGASSAISADNIHWTITGPTSVSVNWRGTDSTVSYGPTSAYGSTASGVSQAGKTCDPAAVPGNSASGPYMEAKITGLQANTVYHYKVGTSGADHKFHTPPPAGSSGFTVMVEGDLGDAAYYPQVAPVQSMIASAQPSVVLVVGDITYKNAHGSDNDIKAFNDVMVWSQDAPFMPAWGNHEWDNPTYDDLRNYKGRFDFPNPQSTSPNTQTVADCGEDWYWFDYGNTRFIAYPEPMGRTGGSSEDGAWIAWYSRMSAPDGPMATAQSDPNIKFIVTFGHRPAYSSGHQGVDSTLKGYMDNLGCTYGKYVLNFNGHSHNYERTFPQKKANCSNPSAPGVIHVTVGTGGSSLEQDGSCLWATCTQPSWSAVRYMRLGAMKLSFTASGIDGKFLCGPSGGGTNDINCTQGAVIDTLTIGTTSADTVPPVISSVATPAITPSGATVAWATSDPADSQVEYGLTTSYGSSTALDPTMVSSHSQSLAGLSAATTYHYRVKSKDAAGNLASSTDATLTTAAAAACNPLVTNAATVFSVPTAAKPGVSRGHDRPDLRDDGDADRGKLRDRAPRRFPGAFGSDVRHHYHTDQPWSSDGSLYAIQNEPGLTARCSTWTGRPSFRDTASAQLRLGRRLVESQSRAHPHERININGNKLELVRRHDLHRDAFWTFRSRRAKQ